MNRMTHKVPTMKYTITFSILIGVLAAIVISILLTIGLTSLLINNKVKDESISIYIFPIRSMSVMIGGLIASGLYKEKFLQVIGVIGSAYLIILIGWGIIFYDGSFYKFGVGLASVLIGCIVACMIKLKPTGKHHHNIKRSK